MLKRHLASLLSLGVLVFLAAGSAETSPSSGVYFKPKLVAKRSGGIFSYDCMFQLESIVRHAWSKTDGRVNDQVTAFDGRLKDVQLTLVCHYAQGGDRQESVFWSQWNATEWKTVNMPAPAKLEGYDLRGTAIVADQNGNFVNTIKIEAAFRHTGT